MDIRLLGIGIAVTFAIISLSAITLYLAFRIKETFREEKSLKIQLAKTFFLIGILFLAGGMFYFFAQAMYQQKLPGDTNTSEIVESGSFAKNGSVFFGVSHPANIKTDDNYILSFKMYNPSSKIIHNASIKLVELSLLEAKSNFKIGSDGLDLGDIPPGETSGYLLLKSPLYPAVLKGALIFQSQDTDTVIESVKINVLEKNVTPSPSISSPSTSNSNSIPTTTPSSNSTSNSTGSTNTSTPAPTVDPVTSPSPTPSPTVDPVTSPSPTPSPTVDPVTTPSPTPSPTVDPVTSPSPTPTTEPTTPTPPSNTTP